MTAKHILFIPSVRNICRLHCAKQIQHMALANEQTPRLVLYAKRACELNKNMHSRARGSNLHEMHDVNNLNKLDPQYNYVRASVTQRMSLCYYPYIYTSCNSRFRLCCPPSQNHNVHSEKVYGEFKKAGASFIV